jgi:hypothetical protein
MFEREVTTKSMVDRRAIVYLSGHRCRLGGWAPEFQNRTLLDV